MTKSSTLHHDRGGPVNLRGIHYQLLATFREVGAAVRVAGHNGDSGDLTNVTLVIEPWGGGDSSILQGTARRVQQIKTHPGIWSLAELVKRVFPDLFRAYCSDPEVVLIELVTNGQLDKQAQGLAAMLDTRRDKGKRGKAQRAVEDAPLPWFKGTRSASKSFTATFAGLLDYIAPKLSNAAAVGPLDESLHRESVKIFLDRLSLRAGLSFEDQEARCREFLEGWGVSPASVPGAIDQIIGHLLRRGRLGNQSFTFSELALTLGLAQHDLSDWGFLSALSRESLLNDLARSRPGYRESQDVRQADPLTSSILRLISLSKVDQLDGSINSPSSGRPQPIIVWGKSGIGKTWLLARSAYHFARTACSPASSGPALLWLSSQQDPHVDLQAAAQKFCHHLWGRDQALPMNLLADRVKKSACPNSVPWLVVFIDGVQSQRYLDQLGEVTHVELGVLLVIAVTAHFESDSPGSRSLLFLKAPGFNPDEVLRFLERRAPMGREFPPIDVRKLLETPIFTAFYSALKQDESFWQPEDEYSLIQRFWLERVAWPRAQAADVLARLCCSRLREAAASNDRPSQGHLSWAVAELQHAGVTQEELDLLEGLAILIRDAWSRSYSFVHERILQWAAAEGALRAFQAGMLKTPELVEICAAILTRGSQARWAFGYVPADLLWLLLDPDLPETCRSAAEAVLEKLEQHHDILRLKDWLTTLGPRLVSLLFARIRSAEPGDTVLLYTYRDALKRIPGAEVAQHALKLLAEPSLELQEIGVQLLGEREYPPALDTLWALYQVWWVASHSDRPSGSKRREGPWMYHVDIGEKALRRSVRNRPDWLERKLLDAESLGGANSTLLFLLASTPKGEAVWMRHKELLRERLAEDRQRGFVRCIVSFRDREECHWLESRVNETRDLVAPSARGALALLAPESALARVEPEALLDLAIARGWWLPLARIQKPRETAIFLKDLVMGSEKPSDAIFSFSGFELWYPSDLVEFLLEAVQREVEALKKDRVEDGKDRIYAPLLRLADCNTIDQLEVFWNSRHQHLESGLVDLVCEQGPNDTGYVRRGSGEEAGEVLKLMAGPGMARAGSSILHHAKTWPGGLDGLDFAVREPDDEARATIRCRALDLTLSASPNETEYPILQFSCLEALAYLRDFEGFARGVVQWGLQLPSNIALYLDNQRGAQELLRVARDALELRPIPPGAFMLLGLHGGAEALTCLRKYGPEDFDSRDVELGWIVGLDYTNDCSGDTLDVFSKGLSSDDNRIHYCSWQALQRRIENPSAQGSLVSAIESSGARFAAALLKTETLGRAVAEILWQKDPKGSFFLLNYASYLEDFAILGTEDVKAFLLGQATGVPDPIAGAARHSAIRGLISFDRELAFRAAVACREEKGSSENEDWPALLVQVGGGKALPYLKVELSECRDIVRLYALGEALRAERQLQIFTEWLQDKNPRVREGACYATCAQAYEPQLEQNVIRCCLDPEEKVRNAAQIAYDHLWRDREVSRLIDRLRNESGSGRRWALIDCALAVGYPGVRPGFGQTSWFSELNRDRPYYEVKYSIDRLKERRKKLVEELKRRFKDFREEA